MQYWFEQAQSLAQSAPLEIVIPAVLSLFFAKKIFKLVVGVLKFGTLAALAVLMFSYVSKHEAVKSINFPNDNYSQLADTAKVEVGERLVRLGERLRAIE